MQLPIAEETLGEIKLLTKFPIIVEKNYTASEIIKIINILKREIRVCLNP